MEPLADIMMDIASILNSLDEPINHTVANTFRDEYFTVNSTM